MFYIKQWILTAVLVSLSGLYAQPGSEDGASFNPNLPNPDLFRTNNSYIREILNRLAYKGDQCLKDRNITGEKQILVIAVLSASEVDDKKVDISEDMIRIVPNECIENPPPYFQKAKVHGEMLAIHYNKTIDGLLSGLAEMGNTRDTRPPYVFVFSHYITCACVANVHYSCAEELANLGRVNRNRYEIIVGYRDVWIGTNLNFAENLLQEGGIHTAMNISSGQVLHKRLKIEPEIYQEKFTVCLRNLTMIPENSAANFINAITKNCTSGNELYGYITQYTKAIFDKCVEEYVKGLPVEFYARYCSLNTLSRTMRLMLGRPVSMGEASWTNTSDDLNWKKLYSDFSDLMPSSFPEFSYTKTSLEDLSKYCTEYIQDIKSYEGHTQNSYQKTKLNILKNDIDYEISQRKKNNQQQQQVRELTRNGQSRGNTNKKNEKIRNGPN